MINEERTLADFKYTSDMLACGSNKHVWRVCECCGKEDNVVYKDYARGYQRCHHCAGKIMVYNTRGPFNIEYFDAVQKSINNCTINELKTFAEFKYYSIDLSYGSEKKVYRICATCGKEDEMYYCNYLRGRNLCSSCVGKSRSHSDETRKKMSIANKGKKRPEEFRRKYRGKGNPSWKGGVSYNPYCPAFNENIKEYIRDKYDRRCFLCNKLEKDNITSTERQHKLSVHHVDMNKQQGCNEHEWKLVPLCMQCHNSKTADEMQQYIEYILENES